MLPARALAKQIRSAGLQVTGYCRSTYFPSACKAERQANDDDNKVALRFAAELRARCFVLVVGGLAPGSTSLSDARRQVRDGIATLMEEAQALDVPLAIEPLHPMYTTDRACVNTIEQALDVCTEL